MRRDLHGPFPAAEGGSRRADQSLGTAETEAWLQMCSSQRDAAGCEKPSVRFRPTCGRSVALRYGWNASTTDSTGYAEIRLLMKIVGAITLTVLLSFLLLMNGCSWVMSEQRAVASSGMLTARAILLNGGAMSDYNGAV